MKVYTSSFCWTTLRDQFKLMQEQIGELCDVHLLYMGPGKYAEIQQICAPIPNKLALANMNHTLGVAGKLSDVTPKNAVTPNKERNRRPKVTHRGETVCSTRSQTLKPSIKNNTGSKRNKTKTSEKI